MPNPFNSGNTDPITNTEYQSDIRNTTVIKYTNSPTYTPTLLPGELAYNYMSGTMFIGALNPSDNPKTLIANNNSFQNFLTTDINLNVSNKVPTSRSVRLELDKKADLTHSNQFVGMNEFPYLRIRDAAPAQLDIAVTIRMLEDWMLGDGGNINNSIINDLIDQKLVQFPKITFREYSFLDPLLIWNISHEFNTINLDLTITDENGIEQKAPYNKTNNSIQIVFSTPVAGKVRVVFYV